MKRTLLAALALFFTISSGLAAAGNMTFTTLHPTNSASGTFESTSWLAYKQTEALARMADALAGSGLVVTGTVVTLTNVSAMIAGQTGAINMNQTNAIPAGSAHIGEVSVPVSTNYVGGFTSICKGAISNDTSASYGIGDIYAAVFTCTNAAHRGILTLAEQGNNQEE